MMVDTQDPRQPPETGKDLDPRQVPDFEQIFDTVTKDPLTEVKALFPRGKEDSIVGQCWRVIMNAPTSDEPITTLVTAGSAIHAIQRAAVINGRDLESITNVGASLLGLVYL